MKLIISPAKKMRDDTDSMPPRGEPAFLPQAELLLEELRRLDRQGLKRLLTCNDSIAELAWRRYAAMDLRRGLTPAILSYDGIQYRYMAPAVFTTAEFEYVEEHLRILSGLYGLLRPFDGVRPYRLEMQAKLNTGFGPNLYAFWGSALADALTSNGERTVVNLASEEYARAVRPFLSPNVRFITPVFGQEVNGRVMEKGVYVKMARGEMVRFLAERESGDPDDLLAFDRLGYRYRPDLSGRDMPVFVSDAGKRNEE